MSRIPGWESLQERLSQSAETVTRNARIDISGGDVDEIDPPEDLDEYAEQAKETAIVRANLRQFVQDVTKPGYRLEGPDKTVAYFVGEDDEVNASPPEDTPEGGFLENSFIIGGEKRKDFYFGLQQTIWERWVRGTVLVEFLKAEKENPESPITGFYHIRPETVYPQVHNNTNILIGPDETDEDGVELTPREEAAAYIQFDDNSIIGLRREGYDNTEIPLSLNDVLKQTLESDIGGDRNDDGVFGTSVMEAISTDVEEYNQIKRDRARAVKTKAYGIWNAQFLPEVIEHGNGTTEVIRWDDESIQDTEDEIENLGPGSTLTSDAKIELEQFDGDVPNLDPTLKHYVNDILSALPAPKYAVGFAEEITQFVSERQENAYQDTIAEERQYQERSWTAALKTVAERQGLKTEGLKLKIEPEEDDSPIMSLSMDEIDKIDKYATALSELAGPTGGATTLVDRETILTEIAQLPEEAVSEMDLEQIAEEGGDSQPPEPEEEDEEEEDGVDELDADAMYEDWAELVEVEALASFSEGDWVDTPDGKGVAGEPITGGTVDDMEASEDEPVYPVALLEEAGGPEFFRESDLSNTDGPEIEGVDSPEEDVEAMAEIASAVDPDDEAEALVFGEFSYPDSWEESSTPNRAILLDAWSSMGGTFTGCRAEGLGRRLCASMKDAVWMTHDWRGGWT